MFCERLDGKCQFIVVCLLMVLISGMAFGQRARLVDELAEIYPDQVLDGGLKCYQGDTARGVVAGVNLLIGGLEAKTEIQCLISQDGRVVEECRIYRFVDVPVEENTGIESRTEKWDGKENPYVIRDAPFRIYEALVPVDGMISSDGNGGLALRVEVPIGTCAEVEVRDYVITVKAKGWQEKLDWKLKVHDAIVRPLGEQRLGYTNWFSLGNIASRHKLEKWSEPFWEMLGKYAALMAKGRQNTFIVPWGEFVKMGTDGTVSVKEDRFKRYIKLFLDRGFTRIESGHLARRHNNDWASERLDSKFTGTDVNSEKGRQELAAILKEIRNMLDKLKLPKDVQFLQHLTDEPTDTNAESYKELAKQVRKHFGDVDIFEATMSSKLVGAVNHWCPQVQVYQKNREFFESRKKAGDKVWVYTCLIPGGKWLNRTLDMERLRQVYLGWSLARYDQEGFLHWGLNYYHGDPFKQSAVKHPHGADNNFLPAGDTHVFYPGENGPLSGQRFEAHRIGMEDADLLLQLKVRSPERADAIMKKVFRSYNDYTTDLQEYRQAKRQLLEAVSQK